MPKDAERQPKFVEKILRWWPVIVIAAAGGLVIWIGSVLESYGKAETFWKEHFGHKDATPAQGDEIPIATNIVHAPTPSPPPTTGLKTDNSPDKEVPLSFICYTEKFGRGDYSVFYRRDSSSKQGYFVVTLLRDWSQAQRLPTLKIELQNEAEFSNRAIVSVSTNPKEFIRVLEHTTTPDDEASWKHFGNDHVSSFKACDWRTHNDVEIEYKKFVGE